MKRLALLCASLLGCGLYAIGQTCSPTNTSSSNTTSPLYFCNRCPSSYPGGALTGTLIVSDNKSSQITVTVPRSCGEFAPLTLGALSVTLGANDRLSLNPDIVANPEAANFSLTGPPAGSAGNAEFIYRGTTYSTAAGGNSLAAGVAQVKADAAAAAAALPVSLLYWDAKPTATGVDLSWATAQEEDNDFFTIEHSTDGRTFARIARIVGAGSSDAPQSYIYRHEAPVAGTNYYRLLQYDLDGTATVYSVQAAEYRVGTSTVGVFPNPVAAGEVVRFPAPVGATVAQLYQPDGRLVLSTSIHSIHNASLSLPSDLKAGMYILRIDNHSERLLVR